MEKTRYLSETKLGAIPYMAIKTLTHVDLRYGLGLMMTLSILPYGGTRNRIGHKYRGLTQPF